LKSNQISAQEKHLQTNFLVNLDGKILNKIFAEMNNPLKRLYSTIKVDLFQGFKDGSTCKNH
jgi:hypothetical protein